MGVILLGKIKIYEIAKKLGLASKEVLEVATKLNIEVKSHMSGVEEEDAKKIEASLTKKANNSNQSATPKKEEKNAKQKKEEKTVIIMTVLDKIREQFFYTTNIKKN